MKVLAESLPSTVQALLTLGSSSAVLLYTEVVGGACHIMPESVAYTEHLSR